MSTIREITMQVKSDSFKMAALDNETRNKALQAIIDNLQAHKAEIFAANAEDLKNGEVNNVPQPVMKRLKFDEAKLADVPLVQSPRRAGLDEGDKLGRARAALNKNPNSTEALAALFAAM